jgi:hypothetical protein
VIEAHGGLENWNRFSDFATNVEIRGRLCEQTGWTGMVPESRLLLSLREQRTIVSLQGGHGTLLVQPDLVSHLDEHGEYQASLGHPREALLRNTKLPGWDVLKTGYFLASIIRYSVTAPFLYASPGFQTEEIEPWIENGETWRGLKILFPREIEAPIHLQHAYYGPNGLLRRLRNKVDVMDDLELVSFVTSYDLVEGIWIATCRDVFACNELGLKLDGPPLGEIRLTKYFLSERL